MSIQPWEYESATYLTKKFCSTCWYKPGRTCTTLKNRTVSEKKKEKKSPNSSTLSSDRPHNDGGESPSPVPHRRRTSGGGGCGRCQSLSVSAPPGRTSLWCFFFSNLLENFHKFIFSLKTFIFVTIRSSPDL